MAKSDFSRASNYALPKNIQQAINFLAGIMKIDKVLVKNGDLTMLSVFNGAMLYRHLDRNQRTEVMTLIRSLPNRRLQNRLVGRILDVTYVNPRWGIWSLSTAELMREMASNTKFQKILTYFGVAGGVTIADGLKKMWKNKSASKGGGAILLANVVLFGIAIGTSKEAAKMQNEWQRRHTQIKSVIIIPTM